MAYADLEVLKHHLDTLLANASFWPEMTDRGQTSRQHFLAAGPEICAPLTELLWSHYESLTTTWAMEANKATRAALDVPSLSDPFEVWSHVEFPYAPEVIESEESGSVSIPFQVDIAWYPGHSLTASFVDGVVSLHS